MPCVLRQRNVWGSSSIPFFFVPRRVVTLLQVFQRVFHCTERLRVHSATCTHSVPPGSYFAPRGDVTFDLIDALSVLRARALPLLFLSPPLTARRGQHHQARRDHRGGVRRVPHADDAFVYRGLDYRRGRNPALLVGEGTLREEIER